jgi:HK97 family phage prohead protease
MPPTDVTEHTTATMRVPVSVAALPELGEGVVEAYPSVFDVEYRMGFAARHVIRRGAFEATLAEQTSVPLFWQHAWSWSEQVPIGHTTEAEEAERRLRIVGQLYLDDPTVARVWQSMMAGALREWSICYRIILGRTPDQDEDLLEVLEAELLEVSVVLRGANPDTETLRVAGAHDRCVQAALTEFRREFGRHAAPPPPTPPAPPAPDPARVASLLARPGSRALLRPSERT